jgi:MFS transporter, MHS family, proline/betaine transporter
LRTIAFAAGLGNFLEWFDFAVYGFFATTIGHVFFPSSNPTASLLSSLAVFGVAFVVRPLGGITIGSLGDKLGRRAALAMTVLLMGLATTLVAVLPGYSVFGIAAPALLVLLRCVQGIAAGGEWASAASYVIEFAPNKKRALWGSVLTGTAAIGSVAGGVLAIVLNVVLTADQLASWGWRIPFVVAAPLALAGAYLRLRLEDTPAFVALRNQGRVAPSPLRNAFKRHKTGMALVCAAGAVHGVCFYYLATYVVNFLASRSVGMSGQQSSITAVIGLTIYAATCPFAGALSDRIGRRPSLLIGSAGMAVLAIPAFLLMSTANMALAVVGMTLLSVFEAAVNVSTLVLLVEMFPTATRMSGGSTSYNVALAALAGPAPLIAAALSSSVSFHGAAAFYMVGIALIGFLVLIRWLPETAGAPLVETDEEASPAGRALPQAATSD